MRSMIAVGLYSMLAVTCIDAADEAKPQGKERFDMTVREDFVAGFKGDDEAFARGFKKCDVVLIENLMPGSCTNASAAARRSEANVGVAGRNRWPNCQYTQSRKCLANVASRYSRFSAS